VFFLFAAVLEISSYFLLRSFEAAGRGGELIHLDSDLFNRNLRKYAEYKGGPFRSKDRPDSFKTLWHNGPYNVIVFGSSVAHTGWVEILNSNEGIKSVNLLPKFFPFTGLDRSLSSILRAHKGQIRQEPKTILLYADITERRGRAGRIKQYSAAALLDQPDYEKRIPTAPEKLPQLNSAKVFRYLIEKYKLRSKGNGVALIDIRGRTELFYGNDLKGLSMNVAYSEKEYLRLAEFLKDCKRLVAESGFVFAIAVFPTKAQQYEWLLPENQEDGKKSPRTNLNILKKAALENDIPFIDVEEMLDPFARKHFAETGTLLWNRADTHINRIGNQYTAQVMKSFILKITENNNATMGVKSQSLPSDRRAS